MHATQIQASWIKAESPIAQANSLVKGSFSLNGKNRIDLSAASAAKKIQKAYREHLRSSLPPFFKVVVASPLNFLRVLGHTQSYL